MKHLCCLFILVCCLLPALGCGGGASAVPGTVTIDGTTKTKKTKAMKSPPPVKPK